MRQRIFGDPYRRTVRMGQERVRQYVLWPPVREQPAAPDEKEARAEPRREAQLMCDEKHGLARCAKLTAKAEDFLLIDHVQPRRRLVEEEHGRLLREHLPQ